MQGFGGAALHNAHHSKQQLKNNLNYRKKGILKKLEQRQLAFKEGATKRTSGLSPKDSFDDELEESIPNAKSPLRIQQEDINENEFEFQQNNNELGEEQRIKLHHIASKERIKKGLGANIMQSAESDEEKQRPKVLMLKKSCLYTYHDKEKLYDKRSLFILKGTFFIRRWIVWLIDWRFFEYFILFVIFLNSLCLAIYNYEDRDSLTTFNQVLDMAGMVFTGIFTAECVLKILAMGLVIHKNAYMRTGMKKLVKALISSIPDFLNVVLFLLFIFILFSILGVHQYQGILYNRCRFSEFPESSDNWLMDQSQIRVCSQSGDGIFSCPVNQFCGNPQDYRIDLENENLTNNAQINYGISTFDNLGSSLLTVFQIITLDGWSTFMYNLMDTDTPFLAAFYCLLMVITGSFFLMNLILAVIIQSFIKIQQREIDDELMKFETIKHDDSANQEVIEAPVQQNTQGLKSARIMPEIIDNQQVPDQETYRESVFEQTDYNQQSNISLVKKININQSLKNNSIMMNDSQQNLQQVSQDFTENSRKIQSEKHLPNVLESARPDLSFLKPISMKRKVVDVFSKNSKEKLNLTIIERNNEDEDIDFNMEINANQTIDVQKKEDEEKPNITMLFSKLATFKSSNDQNDPNNQEQDKSNFLSTAFQNFLQKKKGDYQSKDEYFNLLFQEKKDNYLQEKQQIQSQTSMRQLTHLKVGMRLKRAQMDLSKDYRKFKEDYRAENNKLYMISYKIAKSKIFTVIISFSIIINTIILALDKYPEDQDQPKILDNLNIVFSAIFILEMIIKLLAFGFKGYFVDPFNTFDCIVVIISIIDLTVSTTLEDYDGGALAALRSFRLLRIFKLAKSWKKFQDLLKTMWRTLKDISTFSILLFLFIFTYTLLGMEVFGYKVKFNIKDEYDMDNGQYPASNFNGFLEGFTTVFIVLTNDGWATIMYNHYRAVGGVISIVFFVSLIVIGQKILLNLFLAILLENFDEDSLTQEINQKFKDEHQQYKEPSKFSQSLSKLKIWLQDFFNLNDQKKAENFKAANQKGSGSGGFKSNNHTKSISNISMKSNTSPNHTFMDKSQKIKPNVSMKNIDNNLYLEGKSLFLFSSNNKFRNLGFSIVTNLKFDYFIILMILVSGVNLALENPLNDPEGDLEQGILYLDYFTTAIFCLEAILKILVFGFIFNGRPSYLRNIWNIIDFVIVIFSVLALTPLPDNLKTIKLLRVTRPLRLISRNQGLKIAVMALIQAVPSIANVTIITFLFFIIFGIIGISYFKGKFFYCDTSQETYSLLFDINTKWDCLNSGGLWLNKDYSFDNILAASQTLFQMATTSGWSVIMYDALATTEIDYVMKPKNTPYWALFFIAFIVVGAFFLLNLFVGVVISTFNREKENIGMNNLLTDRQKEWLDSRILVLNSKPIKKLKAPKNPIRKLFFKIQEHKSFDYVILACIIINTVVLTLKWYEEPIQLSNATEIINYIFTGIFITEAIIKIIALGKIYFKDGWNIFDFIIVLGSIASVFLSLFSSLNLGGATTIIRAFRISRVFRLIKRAKSLRLVFNTFIVTLPALANVGSLLLLLLYLYSVLGVFLFAEVKRNGILSESLNYESFNNAFLTLFVVATGDDWDLIMKATVRQNELNYQCKVNPIYQDYANNQNQTIGCGTGPEGLLFYYSYILLISLIFLNLFIAIILQEISGQIMIQKQLLFSRYLN